MSNYDQVFKNVDDVLWKDAGCSSEMDYIEQTSWMLFLKYLNDYEIEKEKEAKLANQMYSRLIEEKFRWNSWAAPKKANGQIDYNVARTGDDLVEFINQELFPYLKSFKQRADSPNSIEYKVGEIYGEVSNELKNGYGIRSAIDYIDQLNFLTSDDRHELSVLYEAKIKNMGNAGKNGGEYYTPRPLIQTIVEIVNPKIGETVYDGAVGSAGFLCEAFDWIRKQKDLSGAEFEQLQTNTLYGKEKKGLAYILGIMNMILHGVETPNLIHTNTLNEKFEDIQERDRVDVILANPPFGGKEQQEVRQNFPIETGETAYLFLQHFVKKLKKGGRCGVVIKNTFLSNTDKASIELRKQLLEECNLHTILDMPGGTFLGAGVKTVVLFFEKGEPTKNIWYYQLNLDRNLGKTNPLNANDLKEFRELSKTKEESENSWNVNIDSIDKDNWDLTVSNPNKKEEVDNRTPQEIIAEIEQLDRQAAQALKAIKELL